ncbi:intercellular adhesion molecule 1 [Physeter macrocephalus]|uniref:Intercellular adhesion molecule 1 n=1 Tax=Physeter macrocephalus TaxID=9755 RepID=A0A2Y9TG52_PHYMC|nr:intercellular adhesion molecule 1 [Physeter catodon]|eukprot:XP_023989906.1 intercellular adhesion molecule 1 [Physeter catodon]
MVRGAAHPALLALLALLGALLPGPGGAQISVQPLKAIIPRGGSITVNCSTSCDNHTLLGLETQLAKKEVDHGNNWKIFELSDVQKDSTPICYSFCPDGQQSDSMNLTVYWFPERVELAPLPQWQPVGEHLILRCMVSGGAPRDHLTVVLLHEEKELGRQPAGKGEPAEVTVTVPMRRDDHGSNFSCRTELDLRSQGLGLFQNSSAPRKLRTFVLPTTNPHLRTHPVLEVGTRYPVNCTLDGLFPVSEAEVHLALGDMRLESTITYNDDSLFAEAWVNGNVEEEGVQYLTCTVNLGGQSRSSRKNVTIYSFPAPNLTLSQPEVSEWTTVNVGCEAQAGAVVTLNGAPARPPGPRVQLQLNASAEDNGRSFFCSAALEVADQVVLKHQTRELRVLYGPRLNERDCLGNWTWQEGSQQTLRCQAWGNPTPKLNCSRKEDGALLPIGDLRPVKREVAGTYQCRATSTRGEVTREVVIKVIYHQNNMAIVIPVASVIILVTVGTAAYIYNYQRKIQKYELQKARKAQEEAAMKLNTTSHAALSLPPQDRTSSAPKP